MIRVDRSRVRAPAILVEPAGKGERETKTAVASLAEWTQHPSKWSFKFTVYSDREVKEALAALFHGKCAYCESSYDATQPMDVEHWRPKAQVESAEHRPEKPAYYWLAAAWDNLLPSCIDCNRRRTQTDVLTGKPRLAGKADQFPLDDGSLRATAPGEETQEVPLLLHPGDDQPEGYLEFTVKGIVKPRTAEPLPRRRARASIDVYALNRTGLVLARKEHLRKIKLRIARIRSISSLLEKAVPKDVELVLEELLLADLRELARMRRDDQPYALQARQLIDSWMEDLVSRSAPESAYATPEVPGRAE